VRITLSKGRIILDEITKKNIESWLKGSYDEETKKTIKTLLEENPKQLIDSFYTKLIFGTGGLRGLMGIGSNRMNVYTVRSATQGVANTLLKKSKKPSVFIGFDSRLNSQLFAEEAAKVLSANLCKVFLCKHLRPTPYVSFGCRYKGCDAAIMITASHNPAVYNGYKLYGKDGGQVVPPLDAQVIEEVNRIEDPREVKVSPSLENPYIIYVEEEIDNAYIEAISSLQIFPKENKTFGRSLKIIYSSLHGTGITLIKQALNSFGFTNIINVEEQVIPDGRFPTVSFPNPEIKETLEMGISLLEEVKGDLFIANDPDADRVGVVVNHHGDSVILNGNQIACILLYHVIQAPSLPKNSAFIKTIVTTELFQKICDSFHRPCFNVLTGFKYIAEKIQEWEEAKTQGEDRFTFIFGGEESYGYLFGTKARDKDAIVSSALICEAALQAKLQGKTLVDLLEEIYKKFGLFVEVLESINFPDTKEGKEQMERGMKRLFENPPKTIDGVKVIAVDNYKSSLRHDFKTNETTKISLPQSEVLTFWLEEGTKLIVRPSGTEPKIKIYCGLEEGVVSDLKKGQAEAEARAQTYIKALEKQAFRS
jgi:phosphoglucomutase/phosphomannomutase